MHRIHRLALLALGLGLLPLLGVAQGPREKEPRSSKGAGSASTAEAIVNRMFAFDANKDGKLAREEVTDPRLLRLFDQADANKDGVVTREEMTALATRMVAEEASSGGRGGFGPPGEGGPGGPGGRFGPPRPGQLLPSFAVERLELSAEQKKQLDELQKDVDARLGKILTEEQKKQLREMRGPGGPGGRGGPGGPSEK